MANVPLADFIAGTQGGRPVPLSEQIGPNRSFATAPPRAEDDGGISAAQAIGAGLKLAPRTFSVAANPTIGGGVGLGLAAGATALGMSDEETARKAGGATTLASPLVEGGVNTAVELATGAPSFADAAQTGFGGLGFMAAWNAPQMAGALFNLIEGNEAAIRRAKRDVVAKGLSRQIGGSLLRATAADMDSAFAQPVGGARVGDAIAAMIRFSDNGTWGFDTAHGWLPDPALAPLRRRLAGAGYSGEREPKMGDVGGVGEIVAGGGEAFIPADLYDFLAPNLSQIDEGSSSLRHPLPESARRLGFTQAHMGSATPGSPELAAFGWDLMLRNVTERLTGQPITTPSPFTITFWRPTTEIIEGTPQDEGGQPATRYVTPTNVLDIYAGADLPPGLLDRISGYMEARNNPNPDYAGLEGGGSG